MTGPDTDDLPAVPVLGDRVDRHEWGAASASLTCDRNLTMLRAFQNEGAPVPPVQGDETQPPARQPRWWRAGLWPGPQALRSLGDAGRRGQLQNPPSGPTMTGLGSTVPDDQFGGLPPDDAYMSGVILRLNDDG